jgi:hypothetical protein
MTSRVLFFGFMALAIPSFASAQTVGELQLRCHQNYRVCPHETSGEAAACNAGLTQCLRDAETRAQHAPRPRVADPRWAEDEACYDNAYDLAYDTARLLYTPRIYGARRGIERNQQRLHDLHIRCHEQGYSQSSQDGEADGAEAFLRLNPSLRPATTAQENSVCQILQDACSGGRMASRLARAGAWPLMGPSLPLINPLTCRLLTPSCSR